MDPKSYTEVLIDGKIYTLGGDEGEGYLQRVASYINDKHALMRRQEGFLKQSADFQAVMTELNIADDYFKAREQIAALEKQKSEMEKEAYSLKHELVSVQMKLEASRRELEAKEARLEEMKKQAQPLREELEKLKAIQAAAAAAAATQSPTGAWNSAHNGPSGHGGRR